MDVTLEEIIMMIGNLYNNMPCKETYVSMGCVVVHYNTLKEKPPQNL